MGLPINSYRLFEEILLSGSEFPRKIYSLDFKLYAILLHDPKTDPEFDKEVGTSFTKWHLDSGNEFLFTALADPPESWLEWAKENKGQFFGGKSELREVFNPSQIYQTFDPSLTALFISEFLGIPFIKLPVIIFTPDLNLQYFYWMPTSVGLVHRQFAWLKSITVNLTKETLNDLAYSPFKMGKIDLENRFSEILVELCQKISDFTEMDDLLCSFAPRSTLRPINKNQSEKDVELNLFYSGIEYLKKKKENFFDVDKNATDTVRFMIVKDTPIQSEEETYPKTDKSFFSRIFNISKKRTTRKSKSFEDLVALNLCFLQKESKLFLEQGIRMAHSLNGQSIYDYSPMILPFAKSFEKELSYSIVHWVRKKYDITLPQYFYEFQPDKIAQVKLGRNYAIDFNQSRNDLWASPTLGGQISGFKHTVLDSKDHPFKSDEDYQQFLNLAYQIKNIRNRACHSDKTSKEDLDKILSCWKGLFDRKYFETLSKLKKEYQG